MTATSPSRPVPKTGLVLVPAELMKIAYILMMALIVTKHNTQMKERTLKSDFWLIAKMLIVTLPVLALIMAQDDFGTMLVFLAIFGGVFLMSGISWRIIVPVIALAVIVGAGTIFLVTTEGGRDLLYKIGFKSYQFARIDSWLDPFHDTTGMSYQPARGLLAIGTGGLLGKGFNVSNIYVPVRESDMVFFPDLYWNGLAVCVSIFPDFSCSFQTGVWMAAGRRHHLHIGRYHLRTETADL